MTEYTIRVRLPNGVITETVVTAISSGVATEQIKAMYGPDSFCGILNMRDLNEVR
jgi:hypothetical protein